MLTIPFPNSVNCRLPHTPRTPGAGMSHYFDDILHRHMGGAQTPRSPMLSPTAPRLRRSSTSRSIAARSDFSVNHLNPRNGSYDSVAATDADVYGNGKGHDRRGSVGTQAMMNHPDRVRARQEADRHLHTYISRELERVRLERGADEEADEFEVEV